jgi:hypothetical protein
MTDMGNFVSWDCARFVFCRLGVVRGAGGLE